MTARARLLAAILALLSGFAACCLIASNEAGAQVTGGGGGIFAPTSVGGISSSSGGVGDGGIVVYQTAPYLPAPPGVHYARVDIYGDSMSNGNLGEVFQAVFPDTLNILGSGIAPLVQDGGATGGSTNQAVGGTTCEQADTSVKTHGPALVAAGIAAGIPTSVGIIQCIINDIAFQDAGPLPDGAVSGVVQIENDYTNISNDMRDAGYAKVLCDGPLAWIYDDPNANPIGDYTNVSLQQLTAALHSLPPGICDGIIDYTAANRYPNAATSDAVLGVVDGGSISPNYKLPPDLPDPSFPGGRNWSSYTSDPWRLDGISHKTKNADACQAYHYSSGLLGVLGYDGGQGLIMNPIDPTYTIGEFPITSSEDATVIYYGDDQGANLNGGPNGPFHSLTYSFDAGIETLTPLDTCWGTGSIVLDAGADNAGLSTINNYSQPGETCASLIANRVTVDQHISTHVRVLIGQCGISDLINGTPPATVATSIGTLASGSCTAGWAHYLAETVLYNPAVSSTLVDTLNTDVRALSLPSCARLADVAADPQLGAALGSATRAEFFSDGDGGLENFNGGTRHAQYECGALQDAGAGVQ